jgi:hypothetical protein
VTKHIILRLLGLTMAGLLLIGCGNVSPPPDSATPTSQPNAPQAQAAAGSGINKVTTTEDGWTLYEKGPAGFAIAVAPSWGQIDMDPATMDKTIWAIAKDNAELANLLKQQAQSMLKQNTVFFAYDPGDDNRSASGTNVNIIKRQLNPPPNLDDLAQVNLNELESLSNVAKPLEHSRVELPAGPAQEYRLRVNTGSGDKTRLMAINQYLMVKDADAWWITFTTPHEQFSDFEPLFQRTVESFAFLN